MKSEKAMEAIKRYRQVFSAPYEADETAEYCRLFKEIAEIAEQEAEERMRQKAISAFDAMWFGDGDNKCDTCESGNCDDCECCASEFEPDYEYHRKNFIQKLNEE